MRGCVSGWMGACADGWARVSVWEGTELTWHTSSASLELRAAASAAALAASAAALAASAADRASRLRESHDTVTRGHR